MDHIAHAWICLRAIQYLESTHPEFPFLDLLKDNIRDSYIACWLPDKNDSKLGGGDVDNHIFKLEKMEKRDKRFVVLKKDLINKLGYNREVIKYLEDDKILDTTWWQEAYKANPKPGEHIPNRIDAFVTTISDLIILGDTNIQNKINKKRVSEINPKVCTNETQLATYFYMVSHFVSDTCMPSHCDARPFNSYSKGYHNKMEMDWSKTIGGKFIEKLYSNSNVDTIVSESLVVDNELEIKMPEKLGFSDKKVINTYDLWEEFVLNCRAFFALNYSLIPNDANDIKYSDLEKNKKNIISHICLQDAVYNTALVWYFIGDRFVN